MGLIGNYTLLNKMPVKFMGGTTLSHEQGNFNRHSPKLNRYIGEGGIGLNSGFPNGYRFPAVIIPPRRTGNLSSYKSTFINFTPLGSLAGGKNAVGEANITSSGSATIKGLGKLESTPTFALSSSATLKAVGNMVATSAIAFSPSATLKALGLVGGSTSITFGASGTGDAEVYLSGTASISFSGSGSLSGSYPISGTSSITFSPSASLKGMGNLSGTSSTTFSGSLTKGTIPGYLVATRVITFSASGTIKAIGYMEGSTVSGGEELTADSIATTVWGNTLSNGKTAQVTLVEARQNALNAFGAAASKG